MQIAGPTSLPFACYVTGTSPARSSSAGPLAVTRDERSVLAMPPLRQHRSIDASRTRSEASAQTPRMGSHKPLRKRRPRSTTKSGRDVRFRANIGAFLAARRRLRGLTLARQYLMTRPAAVGDVASPIFFAISERCAA